MHLELIFFAIACLILGTIFSGILAAVCWFLNIDIWENIWLLGIPAVLSIVLNILFLELYYKYKNKKKKSL
jgi:uncharacterized membrane protein